MNTTLTLIRHAETVWNREQRIQGLQDSPLTEAGRQQAMLLWRRLQKKKFTAAYSSDLGRSVETAKLALGPAAADLKLTEQLRERNLGEWEGRLWPDVVKEDPEGTRAYRQTAEFRPPGGETWLELQERTRRFLLNLIAEHTGGSIVLFTSGGPVRAALMAAMTVPPETWAGWSTSNTGVSTLENKSGIWRVIRYNDTSHLDGSD